MARRRIWTVTTLEGRELPSLTPVLGLLRAQAGAGAIGAVTNPIPVTSFEGGSGITLDESPPRPNEVARRAFRGTFAGRVVEAAPRLYSQARQFYILAPGNTNQFLHGTLQMRLYTPTATADPFANTGTFSISDRNTGSGGVILANITGDPTQVDARGRPTRLDFVVNGGGGSGGIYASSVGNGTITIRYQKNVAKVLIVGSIFTQGIGDELTVFQSNRHR